MSKESVQQLVALSVVGADCTFLEREEREGGKERRRDKRISRKTMKSFFSTFSCTDSNLSSRRMSNTPGPSGSSSNAFSASGPRSAPRSDSSSSIAKGKQPASTGATPSAGSARVVQPGSTGAGPVSVGGLGGIVRRATQNSILINVCQVSYNSLVRA